MSSSESFDPRTWLRGWSRDMPSSATRPVAPERLRSSPLGFALAAAVLLGGALASYATRSEAPLSVGISD
jgi:hypothetical protein